MVLGSGTSVVSRLRSCAVNAIPRLTNVLMLQPEVVAGSAHTGEWYFVYVESAAAPGEDESDAGGLGMLSEALEYRRARARAILSQKSSSSLMGDDTELVGEAGMVLDKDALRFVEPSGISIEKLDLSDFSLSEL
jgi:hypothetical protein